MPNSVFCFKLLELLLNVLIFNQLDLLLEIDDE